MMKYIDLVRLYHKLESTSKRLDKTYHISKMIDKASSDDVAALILLLEGKVFPDHDQREIGVAAKTVVKSLMLATGTDLPKIESLWKETGDLGEVARRLIPKKEQQTLMSIEITVQKVIDNIKRLATMEGAGSVDYKVKIIAELLTSASDDEAKYIIRTVLETLRVGVGKGAIRDAIVWSCFPKIAGIFYGCDSCGAIVPASANCLECGKLLSKKYKDILSALTSGDDKRFDGKKVLFADDVSELKDVNDYDMIAAKDEKAAREIYGYFCDVVQRAYDLSNDFGRVGMIAKEKGWGGLLDIGLEIGVPINVMLYPKAKDVDDAFGTVGRPCACEYKFDGFRMQIHRNGDSVRLITRRLEEVTAQFPDVVKAILEHTTSEKFIIDCEIIGIEPGTGKWLSFQHISQRIKRKYDIADIINKIPVAIKVFDAMDIDGNNILDVPFKERRDKIISILNQKEGVITAAEQIVTDDNEAADKFYKESLRLGNEGIMMKNLEGLYKPGARVGYCVKIKPVMESLDLVITEAEWGEGKRSGWLTSFSVSCMDDDGNYVQIGKVSTGLKEKEEEGVTFKRLTDDLMPLKIAETGKIITVKPEIVIEVHYEEIQKSTNYSSGYALRFPRFISIRDDMRADEISSTGQIEELYMMQRGRNG